MIPRRLAAAAAVLQMSSAVWLVRTKCIWNHRGPDERSIE